MSGTARRRAMAGVAAGMAAAGTAVCAPPSAERGPFATFFAVHCEAHSAGAGGWADLCRLVDMADRYDARLTLMFNPQWADFIVPDAERFGRVKSWQRRGHEIAAHYHNVTHPGWNGHTNRADERYTRDPRYRGTVQDMMAALARLAEPDVIRSLCMGPEPRWDSLDEVQIDETDYPDGILYDVDGMDVGLGPLTKTRLRGRDLFHLKHHFFAPGPRAAHLDAIRAEFLRAGPADVLGVVTHEADFGQSPAFFEPWFRFCRDRGARIRTIREIVAAYPADWIVDVVWTRHDPSVAGPAEELIAKVARFHDRLEDARRRGRRTWEAEAQDRLSRAAADRGDLAEAARQLDRAIELLEREMKP